MDNESIIFDISKISKYKSYPQLLSKYIYKDIFMEEKEKTSDFIDLDIKIDYSKYKDFDIDIESFEDELISIILPNKRLFYDSDYNKKIIYSFDNFRGKNNNLLNIFIIKYQKYFEEINCEEKIKQFINEGNIDIIRIYINKLHKKYDDIIINAIMVNKKYEEFDYFNKLIIDNYKNTKNKYIETLNNSFKGPISQSIKFDFINSIYIFQFNKNNKIS